MEIYCPVCERKIKAENAEEVKSGDHESYLFIHDDIIHDDYDISALGNGIQLTFTK